MKLLEESIDADALQRLVHFAKQRETKECLQKLVKFPPENEHEIMEFNKFLITFKFEHIYPGQTYPEKIKKYKALENKERGIKILTFFGLFFVFFFSDYGFYRFTGKTRPGNASSALYSLLKFTTIPSFFLFYPIAMYFNAPIAQKKSQILVDLTTDFSSNPAFIDFYEAKKVKYT